MTQINGINVKVAGQKVVDTNGNCVAYEMLSRFFKDGEMLHTYNTVKELERNGSIDELFWIVLDETITKINEGIIPCADINLSSSQMEDDSFIDTILTKTAGLSKKIGFEISEDAVDMIAAERNCRKIVNQNHLVLVDDFGTGATDTDRLALPVDIIKLDKVFLSDRREEMSAVINTIKTYGHTVLIEGVETEEDFAYAMACGCDLFQGYYFHKPEIL